MEPASVLDFRCRILIYHITNAKQEWLWFHELLRICNSEEAGRNGLSMPEKTLRVHLEHLRKERIIEYDVNTFRKGAKKRFRLSPDHIWRKHSQLEWCHRIHDLIKEAITYLGKKSLEQQLSGLLDLKPPVKGRLQLEYGSRVYMECKRSKQQRDKEEEQRELAYRGMIGPDMLLEIRWEYINSRHANFALEIHPSQTIQ